MPRDVNATTKFAELLVSEQGFRSLVENAAVAVAVTDNRGRLVYVNKAMTNLLGYAAEEMLGRSFRSFLHPEDREK